MIADKDYCDVTINYKERTLARIYLDQDMLTILLARTFAEIREASLPGDFTDADDILDRVNYINDLSESLGIINGAIRNIVIQERLENIPEDEDE